MTDTHSNIDCKFTARIEREGNRFVVEIPQTEIDFGTVTTGDICQVSLTVTDPKSENQSAPGVSQPQPPVSVGEHQVVEIEDMGDQGDGIARVDRGYVLIVPETDIGDEVRVEVQSTNPNYGFATIVEEEFDTE